MQLNSLEQSDREDVLAIWLEEHGIADPWKLSANLVEAGIDVGSLERISEEIDASAHLGIPVFRFAYLLTSPHRRAKASLIPSTSNPLLSK